jgi:hypothetical protein
MNSFSKTNSFSKIKETRQKAKRHNKNPTLIEKIDRKTMKSLKKRPSFAKVQKPSPHVTNGVLWCKKIPKNWSPYSPHVARGSKVGTREEREGRGGWVVLVFLIEDRPMGGAPLDVLSLSYTPSIPKSRLYFF